MSTRLQVVISDQELKRIKNVSRKAGKSVSDWVRSLIREKINKVKNTSLDAVEQLASLDLPAPSIDEMLGEIENGRA